MGRIAGALSNSYLMNFAARRSELIQEEWLSKHRRAMKQYDLEAVYHEVMNFHGCIEQLIDWEFEAAPADAKSAQALHARIVAMIRRFVRAAEKLVREAESHGVDRFTDNKADLRALKAKLTDAREWLNLDPPGFLKDPHFQELARKHRRPSAR